MSTVEARVASGVELMDSVDRDWLYEIDLETLDICEAPLCILGQQPGGFVAAAIRVGLGRYDDTAFAGHRLDYGALPAYGFAANVHQLQRDIDAEYTVLTREWVRVITERRAADAAAAGK